MYSQNQLRYRRERVLHVTNDVFYFSCYSLFTAQTAAATLSYRTVLECDNEKVSLLFSEPSAASVFDATRDVRNLNIIFLTTDLRNPGLRGSMKFLRSFLAKKTGTACAN